MRLGVVLSITGRLMVPFCSAFAFPTAMALRDGLFDPEWSFRVDETELAFVLLEDIEMR